MEEVHVLIHVLIHGSQVALITYNIQSIEYSVVQLDFIFSLIRCEICKHKMNTMRRKCRRLYTGELKRMLSCNHDISATYKPILM